MASPVEKKKKLSPADHRLIFSAAIGENQQQKPGSVVTSYFGSKMKINLLRKIWICTDVLMDIFSFFDRPQLGLKLALLSPRFNILVDTHFDGKSELTIWRTTRIYKDDGMPKSSVVIRCVSKSAEFPLPDRPLPNNICFKDLQIEYIDHSVLAFLRANKQIWDRSDTKLDLYIDAEDEDVQPIWDALVSEIWPIFAPNIRHLILPDGDHLDNLRRYISPTILTDLNQLNSITFEFLYPDVIGEDGPNATAGQALSKWLHTPTTDGQPKRLWCRFYTDSSIPTEWVENFKKAFLCATTSSSACYAILFYIRPPFTIVTFELVNERTQEKLTLEKERNFELIYQWVMKRCQIGETTDQWNGDNWDNLNKLSFQFYGGNDWMGPLYPPTAEEEAGQSE